MPWRKEAVVVSRRASGVSPRFSRGIRGQEDRSDKSPAIIRVDENRFRGRGAVACGAATTLPNRNDFDSFVDPPPLPLAPPPSAPPPSLICGRYVTIM